MEGKEGKGGRTCGRRLGRLALTTCGPRGMAMRCRRERDEGGDAQTSGVLEEEEGRRGRWWFGGREHAGGWGGWTRLHVAVLDLEFAHFSGRTTGRSLKSISDVVIKS